jgi:hypothetical protein
MEQFGLALGLGIGAITQVVRNVVQKGAGFCTHGFIWF